MSNFKRKLPSFLLKYKEEYATNPDAVPSDAEKQLKDFEENAVNKINSLIEQCGNVGDKENFHKITGKLIKIEEENKKADKDLSRITEKGENLKIKINAVVKKTNKIEDEIPEIEKKVAQLEDEVTLQEVENIEKKEKIKNEFNLLLTIITMYKNYTGCKIRFESPKVVVFEFKKDFYVKIFSEDMKSNWNLLDVSPRLIDKEKLERKLIETDNVQGLIGCLYNAFNPCLDQKMM